MGLSIITPHFNDFEGLKNIYVNLVNQSCNKWQWIIIDDCSSDNVKDKVRYFFAEKPSNTIKVIFNTSKSNASNCRNIGVNFANYENLVFLDSDDTITSSFVKNRCIKVNDFTVFLNFKQINAKKQITQFSTIRTNFLEHFLKAQFPWQTATILWNKTFFNTIGQFSTSYILLEDIELSIRALLTSKQYNVLINNEVDFYYFVKPVNNKRRSFSIVSQSVLLLINDLLKSNKLNMQQQKMLKSYYFLCVRYFIKTKKSNETSALRDVLNNFYSKKVITKFLYAKGLLVIYGYKIKIINTIYFIKINRYLFKKQ